MIIKIFTSEFVVSVNTVYTDIVLLVLSPQPSPPPPPPSWQDNPILSHNLLSFSSPDFWDSSVSRMQFVLDTLFYDSNHTDTHNEALNDLYSSLSIVWLTKSRRMRWVGHVACTGERSIQGFGGET